MIKPTVGRIVLYFCQRTKVTYPAIITEVHDGRCVNLTIFGTSESAAKNATSVHLVQPEDESPIGDYCFWMPYQVKKDFGSESGEKAAGVESIV